MSIAFFSRPWTFRLHTSWGHTHLGVRSWMVNLYGKGENHMRSTITSHRNNWETNALSTHLQVVVTVWKRLEPPRSARFKTWPYFSVLSPGWVTIMHLLNRCLGRWNTVHHGRHRVLSILMKPEPGSLSLCIGTMNSIVIVVFGLSHRASDIAVRMIRY